MSELSKSTLKQELKVIQEDLEGLELYVNEFSSFLPLPILNVNPLGFIIDTNTAFERLTGYKKIEAIGNSLEIFFSEKKRIANITKEALQGKSIKGEELVLVTKKRRIPVSIYLTPRRDREGNIIGYFIGIYDITEFKKLRQTLEEKVKERTKQLQERVDELEKFRKLTEGRELRMVELKEETKKLKEELEKYKGRKQN